MPPARSEDYRGFAGPLLRWFAQNRRDLPWRRGPTPYRTWVAEVMLQQTRVDQAIPYYERFLRRFPTIERLAASPIDEVRKAWEGAGYYARARNLHEAARVLVAAGGAFPRNAAEWQRLPGVGPYIAAAVASLSFGQPIPAVDANALRVAARWSAERGRLSDPGVRRRLTGILATELPVTNAGKFNEAVMELGERICLPKAPLCPLCPVRSRCEAFQKLEDPGALPLRDPRTPRPHHEAALVILEHEGRWLVQRRGEGGLLAGLWEFPGGHLRPGEAPATAARRELREETGVRVVGMRPLGTVRHAYSHFSVSLRVFHANAPPGVAPRGMGEARRWVTPKEFEALPRPMATRKAARLISGPPAPRPLRSAGVRVGPALREVSGRRAGGSSR